MVEPAIVMSSNVPRVFQALDTSVFPVPRHLSHVSRTSSIPTRYHPTTTTIARYHADSHRQPAPPTQHNPRYGGT